MNSSFANLSIGSAFKDFTWDDLNPVYYNISNANTFAGFSFWLDDDKSISEVTQYLLKVGTLAAGDIQLDIYDVGSNGFPDYVSGSLGSTTVADVTTYSSGWNTFSFSTPIALTGKKYYACIWSNLNATPASNYMRFSYFTSSTLTGDGLNILDMGFKFSTNAGTSWTSSNGQTGMWRIKFSDDTYYGFPARNGMNNSVGALPDGATSGWFCGFLSPSDFKIKLVQLQVALDKVGTITSGDVGCYLYNDIGLVATSLNQIDMTRISTTPYEYHFIFDNIELLKNTRYYIIPYYIDRVGTGYLTLISGVSKDDATSIALIRKVMGLDVRPYNGTTSSFSEITTGDAPYYIIPVRLWGNLDEPIVPEESGGGTIIVAYP